MVSALINKYWGFRRPLEPDASDSALAFWIEKSNSDEWSFDDLGRLLGTMLDDGLTPAPALALWAYEVAAKRRARPTRTGPKSNPRKDIYIATFSALIQSTSGMSERAANRRVGAKLNMSPEGVRSACLRARRV